VPKPQTLPFRAAGLCLSFGNVTAEQGSRARLSITQVTPAHRHRPRGGSFFRGKLMRICSNFFGDNRGPHNLNIESQ
jgi:hypothetical protein